MDLKDKGVRRRELPIACQRNTEALSAWRTCLVLLVLLKEDGGIRRLIWTIEMQPWETDCRICCLANQAPQSVRVKCKRFSANANIGCHLFSLHSFCFIF